MRKQRKLGAGRSRAGNPWVAGAIAIVAAAGFIVTRILAEGWGVAAPLLVIAAIAGAGAVYLGYAKKSDAARERTRKRTEFLSNGQLPTIAELPREKLAHISSIHLDYRSRDNDEPVRNAIQSGAPVLLTGPSLAGKSTTAHHAISYLFPEHRVWVPLAPDGAGDLGLTGAPTSAVVLLNDLERYLNSKEPLTDTGLTELLEAGCPVIATMRDEEFEKFLTAREVASPPQKVLERFTRVPLEHEDPKLALQERLRIAKTVNHPDQAEGIKKYGLGPYLAGGYLAINRYKTALHVRPLEIAVLRTATAWQGLGFDDISKDLLVNLAGEYVDNPVPLLRDEQLDEALTWCTETIGHLIHLLEVTAQGRYRVFDYLREHISTSATEPTGQMWELALAAADHPAQAFMLGQRALVAGLPVKAKQAWEYAAPYMPAASFNLGVLLADEDPGAARDAYQAAIASAVPLGDPEVAPMAALNLAYLQRDSSPSEAIRLLREVLADGDPAVAPRAALALSGMLKATNPAGAIEALRMAAASGDPVAAPKAALSLGSLFQESDPVAALQHYETAIELGDSNIKPLAALALAEMIRETDPIAAGRSYATVIASGHTLAFNAALRQAQLVEQSDPTQAKDLYAFAMKSPDSEIVAESAISLAALLLSDDEQSGARNAYEVAIESKDPRVVPRAAKSLGDLLSKSDPARAREAYEIAIKSGDPKVAPAAAVNLGNLLHESDPPYARKLYFEAIASGSPRNAATAALNLGRLDEDSDPDQSRKAFETAIELDDPEVTPAAAIGLGNLLRKSDPVAARRAYQKAIEQGDPQMAATANVNLGGLLHESDADGARRAYEAAIESGDPRVLPAAALNLGQLLKRTDADAARTAFRTAIAKGDPEVVKLARAGLASIRKREKRQ